MFYFSKFVVYNIYMIGRPSKLNEKLIEDMYEIIKDGLPIKYACDLFYITQKSFENWMNQGQADVNSEVESLYANFFLRIKNAQAVYVYEAGKDIKSGRAGWQGAAWWLERTRQDFMPKQQIQADEDGKVTVVIGGKYKQKNYDNDK